MTRSSHRVKVRAVGVGQLEIELDVRCAWRIQNSGVRARGKTSLPSRFFSCFGSISLSLSLLSSLSFSATTQQKIQELKRLSSLCHLPFTFFFCPVSFSFRSLSLCVSLSFSVSISGCSSQSFSFFDSVPVLLFPASLPLSLLVSFFPFSSLSLSVFPWRHAVPRT